MFTIPYNATRQALLHPEQTDDFFQHGPIPSDAALCAEMARVAYVKEDGRLRQYLARARFELIATINYNAPGTQAFVAKSQTETPNRIAVMAFRGTQTDDPSDLFTDARFLMTDWTVDGKKVGRVHEGFASAFREIFPKDDDLKRRMPAGVDRILLTGHSLGAAVATLAASVFQPGHLYTFGSPLVGDEDFAGSMRDVDRSRFVDCCDMVTRVPPEFLGYVHVGALRYIDQNGSVLGAPSDNAIETDRREAFRSYFFKYAFLPRTVPTRDLADHAPINYVSAVMGLRP